MNAPLPPLIGPITFVGDVHGKLEELPSDGPIIQVGDIGMGVFSIADDIKHLRNREDIWFIHGDEDELRTIRNHPRYLGEWGSHEFMFWLGGAQQSILSRNYQGEIDLEQGIAALEAYLFHKPRLMVTHDGPSSIFRSDWPMGGGYSAPTSPISLLLQRMFEAHQPDAWIFGHHHIKRDFSFKNTRFRCLDIWETLTLTLSEDGTIGWPLGPQPFDLKP